MTTIISPAPTDLQNGDLVTITHPNLTGSLGVKFENGTFGIPGYGNASAQQLASVGYVFSAAERTVVNREELTLKGTIANNRITIELLLPSGNTRKLIVDQPTNVAGSREVKITKADFDS